MLEELRGSVPFVGGFHYFPRSCPEFSIERPESLFPRSTDGRDW